MTYKVTITLRSWLDICRNNVSLIECSHGLIKMNWIALNTLYLIGSTWIALHLHLKDTCTFWFEKSQCQFNKLHMTKTKGGNKILKPAFKQQQNNSISFCDTFLFVILFTMYNKLILIKDNFYQAFAVIYSIFFNLINVSKYTLNLHYYIKTFLMLFNITSIRKVSAYWETAGIHDIEGNSAAGPETG